MGLFIYFLGNGQLQADPTSIVPSLIASLGYIVLVCAGNPLNGDGLVTKSATTISKLLADKVVKPFSDGFNNFAATNFSTDFQALTGTGLFSSSILTAATRESIVNAEYTKYLADALANDTDIISSTSFANGFWE